MSLIVNQNVGSSYRCEDSDNTGKDLTKIFPEEVVLKIFSHLNLTSLASIRVVSREWNRLANTLIVWKTVIYRSIAFGSDKWAKCFGADVVKDEDREEEFSSLPYMQYIEDCKKFKRIFPQRKAKDCLMLVRLPKTLKGGLTLKSLGELAKVYFPTNDSGYSFIWYGISKEQRDMLIDKSQWVLMTKDVLPGSRIKSYGEQQIIVAELANKSLNGYEVPKALEAATCILSQYFGSGIRLFSDDPCTYTRCKKIVEGYQVVVGGFAPVGLHVDYEYVYADNVYVGVAALRKF